MGNCLQPVSKRNPDLAKPEDVKPTGKSLQAAAADDVPTVLAPIHPLAHLPIKRALSREGSTTSILSFKSARSSFEVDYEQLADGTETPRDTTGPLPDPDDVGAYEAEDSWCRMDPAAFDTAWLATQNAIFGRQAASLAELPLLPVAPWNKRPGYLGHLTEEQQGKLQALQAAFPDHGEFHNAHDLLRFLRARSFDLTAARKLYSKYSHLYRKRLLVSPAPGVRPTFGDWNLQLLDLFPPRPAEATAGFLKAQSCFLHLMVFHADRLGRPVVYLKLRDMIKPDMLKYVTTADRIAMHSAVNELNRLLCALASAKAGFQIEEIVQVVDVGDLSILPIVKHMQAPEKAAEYNFNSDYCPETFSKIIVVNAPSGAATVWKLAQVFVPPATREKIAICTSDCKAELLKHIAAESIPSCYGGDAPFDWPQHEPPEQLYDTA